MMPRPTSQSLALALALALVAGAGAREAAACIDIGDPCRGLDTWTLAQPIFNMDIPTDGMLLLRFAGPADAPPMPGVVAIEVTLDGLPVAGALEETVVPGILAWRPAAPLAPTATYVVSGTIHNVEFEPNLEFCGAEFEPFEFEFTSAAGPMASLVAPEVGAETEVAIVEPLTLEATVCCDGAYPYWFGGCGGGSKIEYDEGFCAPLAYTGRLDVRVNGTLVEAGTAAPMLAAELVVDGVPQAAELVQGTNFVLRGSGLQPVCTEVVLRNLVTGENVKTAPQCHGQEVAGQLGAQVLTADSPALVANCVGAPYTCEVDEFDGQWDPDRCMAWPEGQASTGEPGTGGPTSSGTGGPGNGGTTGSSGGEPGGTTTGGTGGATSPGNEGLVEHGCACANSRSGVAPWWLALVVLGWRRRRG